MSAESIPPDFGPFWSDGQTTIWNADARALSLADGSVDLVVTSPPYFGLRSYKDGGEHYGAQIGAEATPREFVDALVEATVEMVRVLKPSGSIWINLGDKYAGGNSGQSGMAKLGERYSGGGRTEARAKIRTAPIAGMAAKSLIGVPWRYALRCIDDLGLTLRAEVIWAKANPLPSSVTDRVNRTHEQWFHFTKSPRYFAALDEIREPHTMRPQRRSGRAADETPRQIPRQAWSTAGRDQPGPDGNPLGKIPGSVWTVATQPLKVPAELGIDHFAAFPMEWPRRIIKGWCPEGGTVLDPFGGTGTTALVAKALGRQAHHVDLSADYCRLAQWRINDPKQQARAAA